VTLIAHVNPAGIGMNDRQSGVVAGQAPRQTPTLIPIQLPRAQSLEVGWFPQMSGSPSWIAPHEVLEAEGLEVMLVDTRQLARVPGRDKKSDPFDCEWIQRLHSCGLLMGSFRPKEAVCMLRTLVRDKGNLVAEAGDWLRSMQKSLDQMNVRVHRAVIGHRRSNGDGHPTGDRRRRAGRAAIGETAELALPQERRGDCRAIEGTLAGGSLVQPAAGIEDVRRHPGADHRL